MYYPVCAEPAPGVRAAQLASEPGGDTSDRQKFGAWGTFQALDAFSCYSFPHAGRYRLRTRYVPARGHQPEPPPASSIKDETYTIKLSASAMKVGLAKFSRCASSPISVA